MTLIWPWKFIQCQMSWQFIDEVIVHRGLLICVSNKLWPERAYLMKYNPLKPQWPWFALSILSKVKCHTCCKVNWKAIYDLLYVFHTNFDHMMHHLSERHNSLKGCNLDLTFKGNPRSKITRSTERSYMTLYMCFTQTLDTSCTISEILA